MLLTERLVHVARFVGLDVCLRELDLDLGQLALRFYFTAGESVCVRFGPGQGRFGLSLEKFISIHA